MEAETKQAMVGSTREVWLCEDGEKEPNECWNDVVEAAVEKKEAALKDVLGTKDEIVKENCTEIEVD